MLVASAPFFGFAKEQGELGDVLAGPPGDDLLRIGRAVLIEQASRPCWMPPGM